MNLSPCQVERNFQNRCSDSMNCFIEVGQVDRIHEELEEIYYKLEKIDTEYVSIRGPRDSTIDVQHILAIIKRDKGKDAVIVESCTTDRIYVSIVSLGSAGIVQTDCKESELLAFWFISNLSRC
jgi:hypothetical protein